MKTVLYALAMASVSTAADDCDGEDMKLMLKNNTTEASAKCLDCLSEFAEDPQQMYEECLPDDEECTLGEFVAFSNQNFNNISSECLSCVLVESQNEPQNECLPESVDGTCTEEAVDALNNCDDAEGDECVQNAMTGLPEDCGVCIFRAFAANSTEEGKIEKLKACLTEAARSHMDAGDDAPPSCIADCAGKCGEITCKAAPCLEECDTSKCDAETKTGISEKIGSLCKSEDETCQKISGTACETNDKLCADSNCAADLVCRDDAMACGAGTCVDHKCKTKTAAQDFSGVTATAVSTGLAVLLTLMGMH